MWRFGDLVSRQPKLSDAEARMYEDTKKDLISRTAKAQAELLNRFIEEDGAINDGNNPHLHELCEALEAVFLHGLRGGLKKKIAEVRDKMQAVLENTHHSQHNYDNGASPTFWTFVANFTRKNAVHMVTHELDGVHTEVGYCRAWIRMALNEGALDNYLEVIADHPRLIREHYERWALLADAERFMTLRTLVRGIASLAFDLPLDDASLNYWTVPAAALSPDCEHQMRTLRSTSKTNQDDDAKPRSMSAGYKSGGGGGFASQEHADPLGRFRSQSDTHAVQELTMAAIDPTLVGSRNTSIAEDHSGLARAAVDAAQTAVTLLLNEAASSIPCAKSLSTEDDAASVSVFVAAELASDETVPTGLLLSNLAEAALRLSGPCQNGSPVGEGSETVDAGTCGEKDEEERGVCASESDGLPFVLSNAIPAYACENALPSGNYNVDEVMDGDTHGGCAAGIVERGNDTSAICIDAAGDALVWVEDPANVETVVSTSSPATNEPRCDDGEAIAVAVAVGEVLPELPGGDAYHPGDATSDERADRSDQSDQVAAVDVLLVPSVSVNIDGHEEAAPPAAPMPDFVEVSEASPAAHSVDALEDHTEGETRPVEDGVWRSISAGDSILRDSENEDATATTSDDTAIASCHAIVASCVEVAATTCSVVGFPATTDPSETPCAVSDDAFDGIVHIAAPAGEASSPAVVQSNCESETADADTGGESTGGAVDSAHTDGPAPGTSPVVRADDGIVHGAVAPAMSLPKRDVKGKSKNLSAVPTTKDSSSRSKKRSKKVAYIGDAPSLSSLPKGGSPSDHVPWEPPRPLPRSSADNMPIPTAGDWSAVAAELMGSTERDGQVDDGRVAHAGDAYESSAVVHKSAPIPVPADPRRIHTLSAGDDGCSSASASPSVVAWSVDGLSPMDGVSMAVTGLSHDPSGAWDVWASAGGPLPQTGVLSHLPGSSPRDAVCLDTEIIYKQAAAESDDASEHFEDAEDFSEMVFRRAQQQTNSIPSFVRDALRAIDAASGVDATSGADQPTPDATSSDTLPTGDSNSVPHSHDAPADEGTARVTNADSTHVATTANNPANEPIDAGASSPVDSTDPSPDLSPDATGDGSSSHDLLSNGWPQIATGESGDGQQPADASYNSVRSTLLVGTLNATVSVYAASKSWANWGIGQLSGYAQAATEKIYGQGSDGKPLSDGDASVSRGAILSAEETDDDALAIDYNDTRSLTLLAKVFELCPEKGLDAQNYKCEGCEKPIGPAANAEALLCDYDGRYYCATCHIGDTHVIPARVLHNWDFRTYPVSRSVAEFLAFIGDQEIFDVAKFNAHLYELVADLAACQDLRMELAREWKPIAACSTESAAALRKRLWPREYHASSIDLYSLSDLLQVKGGTLLPHLRALVADAAKHGSECVECVNWADMHVAADWEAAARTTVRDMHAHVTPRPILRDVSLEGPQTQLQ